MNLADVKRQALVLMREWTADGLVIPAPDNIDYLRSMEELANIAQMDIAKAKKIPATVKINEVGGVVDIIGGYNFYDVPADFMELDRLLIEKGGKLGPAPSYSHYWLNPTRLGIVKGMECNDFILAYYRRPARIETDILDENANDDYVFEVAEETHYLIPFFIAAQLLSDEDRGLAQVKLNEYYMRLSELEDGGYQGKGQVVNELGW